MRLPLGVDDFKKLRLKKCDYVDKTLLLKDLLDDTTEAFLITRPRRFGKTLNMSMIRYFFDSRDQEENKALFKGTLIETATLTDGTPCIDFQGQYPVIYLTMKDMRSETMEGMMENIQHMLSMLYQEHHYLLESDRLTEENKKIFHAVVERTAKLSDIQHALKSLCDHMKNYYDKPVIILIDEYDTPMHTAYSARTPYHEDLVVFMKSFLGSAFKSNTSLKQGILTGILRISLMNLFSGLNSLPVCTVLTDLYADYFGFSETEVDALFKQAALDVDMTAVKKWYNGYTIGSSTLYNPWSIISCLRLKGSLQSYWLQSGEHGVLGRAMINSRTTEVLAKLQALIENDSIETELDERSIFTQLENNENALWTLMLYAGYLKPIDIQSINRKTIITLQIPNEEVKTCFDGIIDRWGKIPNAGETIYQALMTTLNDGNIYALRTLLQQYIMETASYYDFNFKIEERFYHIFFLGMFVSLSQTFTIDSNKESGIGRYDIALIPKNPNQKGVILEIKRVNQLPDGESERDAIMKAAVQDALNQIDQNLYKTNLIRHGVKQAVHIGIAMCGKVMASDCVFVDYQ